MYLGYGVWPQQGGQAGAAGAGHRPPRGFPRRQAGGDSAGSWRAPAQGPWQSVSCPAASVQEQLGGLVGLPTETRDLRTLV